MGRNGKERVKRGVTPGGRKYVSIRTPGPGGANKVTGVGDDIRPNAVGPQDKKYVKQTASFSRTKQTTKFVFDEGSKTHQRTGKGPTKPAKKK